MASRFVFYATAEEQLRWLNAVIPGNVDWCVVELLTPPLRSAEMHATDLLGFMTAKETGQFQVFLGRRALSEGPVWRQTSPRQHVDAIRSRVIHFIPAIAVGRVLLEGGIDILGPLAYKRENVDPKPLQRWFNEMRRSLRAALRKGSVSEIVESEGDRKSRSTEFVFSAGAIKLFRDGWELKQTLESRITIRPPLVP